MINQIKFSYSPLGKAFKEQTKLTDDYGKKQLEALQTLKHTSHQLIFKYAILEDQLNVTLNIK